MRERRRVAAWVLAGGSVLWLTLFTAFHLHRWSSEEGDFWRTLDFYRAHEKEYAALLEWSVEKQLGGDPNKPAPVALRQYAGEYCRVRDEPGYLAAAPVSKYYVLAIAPSPEAAVEYGNWSAGGRGTVRELGEGWFLIENRPEPRDNWGRIMDHRRETVAKLFHIWTKVDLPERATDLASFFSESSGERTRSVELRVPPEEAENLLADIEAAISLAYGEEISRQPLRVAKGDTLTVGGMPFPVATSFRIYLDDPESSRDGYTKLTIDLATGQVYVVRYTM